MESDKTKELDTKDQSRNGDRGALTNVTNQNPTHPNDDKIDAPAKVEQIASALSDDINTLRLSKELADTLFADESRRGETAEQKAVGLLAISGLIVTLIAGLVAFMVDNNSVSYWKDIGLLLPAIAILLVKGVFQSVAAFDLSIYARSGEDVIQEIQPLEERQALKISIAKTLLYVRYNKIENKQKHQHFYDGLTNLIAALLLLLTVAALAFLFKVYTWSVRHDVLLALGSIAAFGAAVIERLWVKTVRRRR